MSILQLNTSSNILLFKLCGRPEEQVLLHSGQRHHAGVHAGSYPDVGG